MSFDIELVTCNEPERTETVVDPFSGGALTKLGGCVTNDQRQAIEQLLDSVRAVSVGEGDTFAIDLVDGGSVEIWLSGFHDDDISGGMAMFHQMSSELSSLVYSLATSGKLAMIPRVNGGDVIVTSRELAQDVAIRWPNSLVAESPEELHDMLAASAAKPKTNKKPWWKFW